MSEARHYGIFVFFCDSQYDRQKLPELCLYTVYDVFLIKPEVHSYLIVSASGGMKFLACISYALGEDSFHCHVNILVAGFKVKSACFHIPVDLLQPFNYFQAVLLRNNALFCKHFSMSYAALYVLGPHAAIHIYRRVEFISK